MATTIALNLPRTQPSLPRIYFNEVRFELLRLSRNRAYLCSMVGFPVIFYLLFGVTNRSQNATQVVVLVGMRSEIAPKVGLRLWTGLAVGGHNDLVGVRMRGKILLRCAGRRGNGGVHTCGAAVWCCDR